MDFRGEATQLLQYMIDFRRELHQYPERSRNLKPLTGSNEN